MTCVIRNSDNSFRANKGLLAKAINVMSPKSGEEYLHSWQKRLLDLSLAIPASIIALPTVLILGLIQKLSDGGNMFFFQSRYFTDLKTIFPMPKIRSMQEGADNISLERREKIMSTVRSDKDPRISGIGGFLRATDLDELPQIFQVLKGIQSIVGVRAVIPGTLEFIETQLPDEIFKEWVSTYRKNSRPGIVGVNQLFNGNRKDNLKRTHYDNFYPEHASLGFDLYMIWRTFLKLSKLEKYL